MSGGLQEWEEGYVATSRMCHKVMMRGSWVSSQGYRRRVGMCIKWGIVLLGIAVLSACAVVDFDWMLPIVQGGHCEIAGETSGVVSHAGNFEGCGGLICA